MSLGALKIRIEHDFRYHAPKGNQAERYTHVRAHAQKLAKALAVMCPLSRELSLALTNLEQTVFWANAAIARFEHTGEESPVVYNLDDADHLLDERIEKENG